MALAHRDGLSTQGGSLSQEQLEKLAASGYVSRWQALERASGSARPAPRPQTVDDPEDKGFWWGPAGRRYYPREYEERYRSDPYYWRPWYYHNPVPHYYRYGPLPHHGVGIGTGVYFHLTR